MFGKKTSYKSALLNPTETVVLERPEENPNLKKVVALAKAAPTYDKDKLAAELADRKEKLAGLFEIERDAKRTLNKQISELTEKHHIAEGASKYDGKYMPISMDVLKWRTDDGLPTLAIFSLNDPVFKISSANEFVGPVVKAEAGSYFVGSATTTARLTNGTANQLGGLGQMINGGLYGNMNAANNYYEQALRQQALQASPQYYQKASHVYPGSLPNAISDCYSDVVEKLTKHADAKSTSRFRAKARIGASFSGVIPDSTRAKIKEAQAVFQDIFILAEPKFSFEIEMVPVPIDPVVMGWDGQQLWYVDDFDITPVEEAALLVGPAI